MRRPSRCLFRAGLAERPESLHVENRVGRLRRAVRILAGASDWGAAADPHAAATERDAAGACEVIAADDAGDGDHVAFARLDLVEEILLAGQPKPAASLDFDARALAFGAFGDDERGAARAAGDGHADRVLGNRF